jgi:TP53 regulating kinase and related kinases
LSKLGISVPAVYFVDLEQSIIYMEYIRGQTVKQFLWKEPPQAGKIFCLCAHELLPLLCVEKESIATSIGRTLGLMHDADIVHGDLTTSNMLLQTADRKLVRL